MRCRHAALDRQAIVEQQHALACPMFEITVRRPRNPKVALHFLIDVDENRRRPHAGLDRKAAPMRLPRPVIGVLAQNQHAHTLRRRRVDRKIIAEGQCVSVPVDPGGVRTMKYKKNYTYYTKKP